MKFEATTEEKNLDENVSENKEKDEKKKIAKISNPELEIIVVDKDFNVEEKLFLNRIAYVYFKKTEIKKINFDGYYKYCRILQVFKIIFF